MTTTAAEVPEPPEAPLSLSAPDDADEYTEEADWLPLDLLILAREPSPPRPWPSHAPILIGFDAASVAQVYPEASQIVVGRMGSDRPRGCRSEIGLRLDAQEWFFPRDNDAKMSAGYRLPRSRFRCLGFPPAELQAIETFPEAHVQHAASGRHPRIDGPMSPRYRGRLVQLLSDAPDPRDDLTIDPEDDVGDPTEPCATTSVWPEKAPRRPSAKGRPGTPAWPRLPSPPARSPGGEPETYAMINEAHQIVSTGLNLAGIAFEGLRHCPVCNGLFAAQRGDAQTCSDACRKARSRWSRNDTNVTAPENNKSRTSATFEASAA